MVVTLWSSKSRPKSHKRSKPSIQFWSTTRTLNITKTVSRNIKTHRYIPKQKKKQRGTNKRTMSSTQTYEPLLTRLHSDSQITERSSPEIEEFLRRHGSTVTPRWWLKLAVWESKLLWTLSGASIVVSVLNYMLSFVTVMFTGHLGSLQLAGASIATVGIQGLAYGIMVRTTKAHLSS